MTSIEETEQSFPSTTWALKKVKISGGAAGRTQQRRSRYGFRRLTRQPRTRPVRLTVTYRGGPESWWFIEARGQHQAFPGWLALEDVMATVLSEL